MRKILEDLIGVQTSRRASPPGPAQKRLKEARCAGFRMMKTFRPCWSWTALGAHPKTVPEWPLLDSSREFTSPPRWPNWKKKLAKLDV